MKAKYSLGGEGSPLQFLFVTDDVHFLHGLAFSQQQLLLVTDAIVDVVNGVHRGYVSAPGVVRRCETTSRICLCRGHGTEWTMQSTIDEEVAVWGMQFSGCPAVSSRRWTG
jgi:hypothetical protein